MLPANPAGGRIERLPVSDKEQAPLPAPDHPVPSALKLQEQHQAQPPATSLRQRTAQEIRASRSEMRLRHLNASVDVWQRQARNVPAAIRAIDRALFSLERWWKTRQHESNLAALLPEARMDFPDFDPNVRKKTEHATQLASDRFKAGGGIGEGGHWRPLSEIIRPGSEAIDSGGKTGSKCYTLEDGSKVQLKHGIDSYVERQAKGGRHVEVLGEFIGSSIARGLAGERSAHRFAKSDLVHDSKTRRTMVCSNYIPGSKGGLDKYFTDDLQRTRTGKHAIVTLEPVPPEGPREGMLHVTGDAAADACLSLAINAAIGNDDCNSNNLAPMEEGGHLRLGAFDFGKSFRLLLAGPQRLGGGTRSANRILDFFNRPTVIGGHATPAQSKFLRDYRGMIPSLAMADAMDKVAANMAGAGVAALEAPKKHVLELAQQLREDSGRASADELQDLLRSLRTIARNIDPNARLEGTPQQVIEGAFAVLKTYLEKGADHMRVAANLCRLQAEVDTALKKPVAADREAAMHALERKSQELRLDPTATRTWLRCDKAHEALVGTFSEYIAHRAQVLGLPVPQQVQPLSAADFEARDVAAAQGPARQDQKGALVAPQQPPRQEQPQVLPPVKIPRMVPVTRSVASKPDPREVTRFTADMESVVAAAGRGVRSLCSDHLRALLAEVKAQPVSMQQSALQAFKKVIQEHAHQIDEAAFKAALEALNQASNEAHPLWAGLLQAVVEASALSVGQQVRTGDMNPAFAEALRKLTYVQPIGEAHRRFIENAEACMSDMQAPRAIAINVLNSYLGHGSDRSTALKVANKLLALAQVSAAQGDPDAAPVWVAPMRKILAGRPGSGSEAPTNVVMTALTEMSNTDWPDGAVTLLARRLGEWANSDVRIGRWFDEQLLNNSQRGRQIVQSRGYAEFNTARTSVPQVQGAAGMPPELDVG